jgi:protocatechuate 3,4-dioxygenase, beta subunit
MVSIMHLITSRKSAFSRRDFLARAALGAAFFTTGGLYAEALTPTPRQTEGPFYPDHLPLDTDNDLLILNNSLTPAVGEVTYLSGRVLDAKGEPMRGVEVEIWQCDAEGAYLHSKGQSKDKRDANFQGFGRFVTGVKGEYLFRTIKPVPYPGRSPHIHYKIKSKGKDLLVTQCYIKGDPRNEKDGVFKNIKDPRARAAVEVDFQAMPNSKAGELIAQWDVVLGLTPEG